jgi:hypothetical protein
MISRMTGGGRLPAAVLAWALGPWALSSSCSSARADGMAYGAAPAPGFYGFGLGYHLGNGYGGRALGVGPDGGYPFYGGPGYPHCEPPLRRLGHIVPFAYYGGPGGPVPGQPHYFGGVGPLAPNESVVTLTDEAGNPDSGVGYGPFNGAIPYPDTFFSPNATRAVQTTPTRLHHPVPPLPPPPSLDTPAVPPSPSPPSPAPPLGRGAGIDAEPVVDTGGVRGMKVSQVYPGSAAEKAGLRAGDVIHSVNGYLTTHGANLAWVIANAAPDDVLKMKVRAAADGREHLVTTLLR